MVSSSVCGQQRRRVVKQSRTEDNRFCVGLFGFVLLSIAVFSVPTGVDAADGKGESNSAVAVIASNNGLRDPLSSGSVVIRGTRPVQITQRSPLNASPENMAPATPGFPIGPYRGGFEPSLTGKGWDSGYDYSGLNWAIPPR
ncbi:MAG: hypothetical protein QOH92_310 [Chloroflexota bacterium]|jgi:hypothetical protein|nr:hypothetical protein [Chloroflexota bacterium]